MPPPQRQSCDCSRGCDAHYGVRKASVIVNRESDMRALTVEELGFVSGGVNPAGGWDNAEQRDITSLIFYDGFRMPREGDVPGGSSWDVTQTTPAPSKKGILDWVNGLSQNDRNKIIGWAMTVTGAGYGLLQKEAAKKLLGFAFGVTGGAIVIVASTLVPSPAH
jgi:hypothetical protein